MKIMKNFETFVEENKNKIFRILELRRVGDWTPLEIEEKYVDQDQYVDNHYSKIKIVEVVELPDKDILIGYKIIMDWEDQEKDAFEERPIYYRKLSQIELSFFPCDMDKKNWD